MRITFEWDPQKAAQNLKDHGVSFDEAKTVFADPLSHPAEDREHSFPGQERFITTGRSLSGRTLVVVHVDDEAKHIVRIISARSATRAERGRYEG
jgi:uncharacterized DUF497 family protein